MAQVSLFLRSQALKCKSQGRGSGEEPLLMSHPRVFPTMGVLVLSTWEMFNSLLWSERTDQAFLVPPADDRDLRVLEGGLFQTKAAKWHKLWPGTLAVSSTVITRLASSESQFPCSHSGLLVRQWGGVEGPWGAV